MTEYDSLEEYTQATKKVFDAKMLKAIMEEIKQQKEENNDQ